MSPIPNSLARATIVLSGLLAMSSFTTAARAEIPPPPECVEVFVLPDDASLPSVLVCRPDR